MSLVGFSHGDFLLCAWFSLPGAPWWHFTIASRELLRLKMKVCLPGCICLFICFCQVLEVLQNETMLEWPLIIKQIRTEIHMTSGQGFSFLGKRFSSLFFSHAQTRTMTFPERITLIIAVLKSITQMFPA